MAWLFYLIIAVVVVISIKIILPSPKKLAAATNALLAEHILQHVELTPDNPFAKELRDKIVDVWRVSGFPNIEESMVVDSFNRRSRFVQLNIIAMAFNELGHDPMLPNEIWHSVSNPFVPGLDNDAHVQAVVKRIQSNHGIYLQIPSRRFQLKEWGLSKGDSPGDYAKNDHEDAAYTTVRPNGDLEKKGALLEHPMITGGGKDLRSYNFGKYKGVLVEAPDSFGPIKYGYVLIVFGKEDKEPVLFVTSEKNEMQATLLAMAAENDPELASELNLNKCFLGIFSGLGRENHGCSMDWCNFEKFEKKALEIINERLGVVVTEKG